MHALGLFVLPRRGLAKTDNAVRISSWPVSTVRGSAIIRPESEDKPTLRGHRKSVENDPKRSFEPGRSKSVPGLRSVSIDAGVLAPFDGCWPKPRVAPFEKFH
jgi:hypothetical protein